LIPQAFIQDLLSRVDVVDVVGRHVQLRKAGANLLGLCPFHAEKSPSFTVSPSKQFYHCFGCGAHGSAIGFLMEHAGLSYVEAIRDLAQSVGIPVPDEGPSSAREQARAPGLIDLLARAERFYRDRLKDSARAVDYLKGRGLSGRTAARFGVGYAPEGWRPLQAAMPDYSAPELLEAGLVIESQGRTGDPAGGTGPGQAAGPARRYDRFRDRIMFPIRNPRGQVIGFGGRIIDSGEPKYMNSPETPLFSKGRELYGLFEGRDALRQANCAIVVEGYMDVVMLAQHGVANCVATLGTSTTPDHVRKLLRVVDRVVFSFDGDAAGRKAAWRALQACLPEAADTKRMEFLFLPAEHDPDSYVRQHGPEGFNALLSQALPLSEFMIQELSAQVDLAEPEGRARFLALAQPLLQALPPAAFRLQLVHRVADVAGVAASELGQLLAAAPAGHRGSATGASRTGGPPWEDEPGREAVAARADPAGQARWRERSGATNSASRSPLRPRAAPPPLPRRIRLLSALHPALAIELPAAEFLPEDLLEWLSLMRQQPAGSAFAVICEALRKQMPDLIASLERDAAVDRSMVAEMTLDEARAEFDGALAQLRDRRIREELDEIVARGMPTEADRLRYQQLLALRARA
jgi:DNA primase